MLRVRGWADRLGAQAACRTPTSLATKFMSHCPRSDRITIPLTCAFSKFVTCCLGAQRWVPLGNCACGTAVTCDIIKSIASCKRYSVGAMAKSWCCLPLTTDTLQHKCQRPSGAVSATIRRIRHFTTLTDTLQHCAAGTGESGGGALGALGGEHERCHYCAM